jgi:hypothetical protein
MHIIYIAQFVCLSMKLEEIRSDHVNDNTFIDLISMMAVFGVLSYV